MDGYVSQGKCECASFSFEGAVVTEDDRYYVSDGFFSFGVHQQLASAEEE